MVMPGAVLAQSLFRTRQQRRAQTAAAPARIDVAIGLVVAHALVGILEHGVGDGHQLVVDPGQQHVLPRVAAGAMAQLVAHHRLGLVLGAVDGEDRGIDDPRHGRDVGVALVGAEVEPGDVRGPRNVDLGRVTSRGLCHSDEDPWIRKP